MDRKLVLHFANPPSNCYYFLNCLTQIFKHGKGTWPGQRNLYMVLYVKVLGQDREMYTW